jgi:peptidyl-prolyl cis-trans isomerase SDCCAG10
LLHNGGWELIARRLLRRGQPSELNMSSQYNIEPHPTARVLIKTSMGPLDVELFAKETPLTCRSFIQLCLEGYYNNAIFHRIVKDFIIQTGDPTGTGTGGEAAAEDGKIKDEFNTRLRYTRRGLVGMANSGDKDDNGSQFFITLSATPELERRNTLFGRIAVGDTIFNALRIGELEVDKLDRPIHPPRIISTEVTENPFKDIVPRSTAEEREQQQRKLEEERQKAVVKKAKKRNKALLSFGDDEAEDGAPAIKTKIKSVYDLDGPPAEPQNTHKPSKPVPAKEISLKPANHDTVDLTSTTSKSAPIDLTAPDRLTSYNEPIRIVVDDTPSPPRNPSPNKPAAPTKSIEDQIAAMKSQLKGLKNKRPAEEEEPNAPKRSKNFLEEEISRYMSSGRATVGKRSRKGRREDDTLALLSKFQSKISRTPAAQEEPQKPTEDVEQEACELHNVPGCMSCFDRFGEQPDDDDPKSLWAHKLVFAKDMFGKDEKFRQQRQGEDLEVIDPRERAKDFAEKEKRNRGPPTSSSKVWRQR